MKNHVEKIVMVNVDNVSPNPRNNNIHSNKQRDRIKKIIRKHGFRFPLTISNRSGSLVSGHLRLEAAKELGMESVPAIYQDFKNEAEEYEVLTADNEIARWAKLDLEKIEVARLEMPEIEFDMLGMKEIPTAPNEAEDLSDKNKEIDTENFGNDLEHTCPKCGFEFNE